MIPDEFEELALKIIRQVRQSPANRKDKIKCLNIVLAMMINELYENPRKKMRLAAECSDNLQYITRRYQEPMDEQ